MNTWLAQAEFRASKDRTDQRAKVVLQTSGKSLAAEPAAPGSSVRLGEEGIFLSIGLVGTLDILYLFLFFMVLVCLLE